MEYDYNILKQRYHIRNIGSTFLGSIGGAAVKTIPKP